MAILAANPPDSESLTSLSGPLSKRAQLVDTTCNLLMFTPRQLGEFARFAIAGSVGFCVDLIVLLTLVHVFSVAPLVAKVGSFAIALPTTWLINRAWTFRRNGSVRRRKLREFSWYLAVQLTGASINYAAFAICLLSLPFTGDAALVLATAAGVAAGMSVNFSGNKWIVFRRSPRTEQSQ